MSSTSTPRRVSIFISRAMTVCSSGAAVPRKRPSLTRHGGILHYVLRQLAAKKAA